MAAIDLSQIETGAELKKVETVDKSAPVIEAGTTIRKHDRSAFLGEVSSGRELKKTETVDKSAPKIEGFGKIASGGGRKNLLDDIQKGTQLKKLGIESSGAAADNFVAKLDAEALAYFNDVANRPFNQQAIAFLNAYWQEVSSEAEFIFSVAYDKIRYADMHAKGISLVFKYDEGCDLDFDIGLYFYEIMCKFVEDPKNVNQWGAGSPYTKSQPEMLTAIKRKVELRDKVDINFDNRISMLEYLLYQYRDVANPADFCVRSMSAPDEHPEVAKARLALEEVNKRIQAYEAEKARLEGEAAGTGVKALGAKNMLAQIDSGPLKEDLNRALITAEAAVRIATKKFGGGAAGGGGGGAAGAGGAAAVAATPTDGAIWWMNRDLADKQARYGKK